MNLFAKKGSWIVATLFAATSVFAQTGQVSPNSRSCQAPKSCEKAEKIKLTCAYNAPARIEVRGCWDLYTSASFTYWQAFQDNMELGIVSDSLVNFNGTVQNLDFDFEPGFKVALGMNFDHDSWDTRVEYTWFRGNTSSSLSVEEPNAIYPTRALPLVSFSSYATASETWKLHMDLVDWELGRSYYVGKKLTFRPFFALRGAWIRQNLDVDYLSASAVSITSGNSKSRSWAVGPRTGVYTDWNLGDGFRLYGNGAGDLLLTRYTTLKSVSNIDALVPVTQTVTQKNLNTLRSHVDLELGLGWGSYFDCNNWHIDLSAGYTFQAFFDQNMFRSFVSNAESVSSNGNLYMQGLTVTARFDF